MKNRSEVARQVAAMLPSTIMYSYIPLDLCCYQVKNNSFSKDFKLPHFAEVFRATTSI